jgi:4-amino-4-deoxy-L-arabinose transferase-like glycosyltransferase
MLVSEWMTTQNRSRRASAVASFPWLTVEISLWGLLLLISLGLRLLRLDAAPLNSAEAHDALAAWRFAQGQGAPTTTGYSPLLFSAQWFTFLVFGGNDLIARLLPALAGTLLTLAPALLRRQLGRLGALAAAALLTISPTALTLSRTASGDVLVALGTLLCTVGLFHFLTNHTTNEAANTQSPISNTLSPYLLPLGLALMLVSSPLAYSALIALGAALLLVTLIDLQSRDQIRRGWAAFRTLPNAPLYMLGVFLGSFVLLSTAFGWHFGGVAAAADLLPQWLDGFVRWPDSVSLIYPAFILVFYEPLILLVGGVGVVIATVRGNARSLFMALWSVVALLLALIRPGRGPGDILLVLVPLACLAGLALEMLVEGLRRRGHWLNEGLYLIVSLPLWAYLVINLVTYSSRSGQYSDINLLFLRLSMPTYLSLVIATAFLLLVLAVGIGLVQGFGPALRGLGLSTTLALLLFTISAAWGVSQSRPADPREPLVLEPTATEVRLLRDTLSRVSIERHGAAHAIDLTLLTDDPALKWALRDFRQAHVTAVSETPSLTSAVIAPQTLGTPPLAGTYVGQSFPVRRRWETDSLACSWNPVQIGFDQARQLDCSSLVDWLVFRRSREHPAEDRVVLWLRHELVGR